MSIAEQDKVLKSAKVLLRGLASSGEQAALLDGLTKAQGLQGVPLTPGQMKTVYTAMKTNNWVLPGREHLDNVTS